MFAQLSRCLTMPGFYLKRKYHECHNKGSSSIANENPVSSDSGCSRTYYRQTLERPSFRQLCQHRNLFHHMYKLILYSSDQIITPTFWDIFNYNIYHVQIYILVEVQYTCFSWCRHICTHELKSTNKRDSELFNPEINTPLPRTDSTCNFFLRQHTK